MAHMLLVKNVLMRVFLDDVKVTGLKVRGLFLGTDS